MTSASSWPGLAPAWQRAALLAWVVAVLTVCILSLNPRTAPPTVAHADKAFHFLAYAALAALAHAAFAARAFCLLNSPMRRRSGEYSRM